MAAIAVFCGSSTVVAKTFLDLAYEVGSEVARRGHTLVSGGGRVGMMGAVAGGARAAGGRTVGVIPEVLYGREVADTDSAELIVTADMADRKNRMVERSDAFVALPGGIGTMDELFEVWTTAHLGLHDKPMVLLSPDDFYAGLLSYVDSLVEHRFLGAGARAKLHVVQTAAAALDVVEAAL
ncbi:LOG family protein [Actinocatenispora rupis]|uniref:Cytokinin riboside 5'-monophosphate phosphoribohydrolase n=1 Tax=Actinocatenispora rupis TaxID=519421 RepID=A0A8J3J537_9ACTN|nr:TIGR00730 family Rossman fold protein [Actinocatenispora rupis]GID11776.1 cytokinin riboside 5'-monophosphate phosphoribohydrolase [Actinocatenispora rupis]